MASQRRQSAASSVIQTYYSQLCELIHNANWLAIQLYSEGLISMSAREAVEAAKTNFDKAAKLLAPIELVIAADSEKFQEFLEVLDKEPYLHNIVEWMKTSYSKVLHGS